MFTHRPVVRAPRAMIASAHPLATQAGLAVLRDGGTAVDAGLAVNAALNVTQSPCCGFGGDGFFLYWDAASATLHGYNGSGRAGSGATPEALRALGHSAMPGTGPLTVTVPGAVEAWWTLHQRFGQLPWAELFAPAIDYARDGFPVSDNLADWIRGSHEKLRHWPRSVAAMLPHGHPPTAGTRLRQPDLAATLEALAAGGAEAFYRGAIGDELIAALRAAGGLLSRDDLTGHCGDWTEPIGRDYRGWRVMVHGPNSQGWALPLMLGLVADRELGELAVSGTEMVHLGVEAKRLAFADRDAYNSDPATMTVAPAELLTEAYLATRRPLLDERRAMAGPAAGTLDGDTTYFCVVDPAGNALSVNQSLYHGFGSGFVAGRTGLFLQNRGAYFSLREEQANVLAPGKRTAHTLCSAMVFRDGRPAILPGTMGGDGQPQILYQLLTAMIDHGCNPQQAIELPRWIHGATADDGAALRVEARFEEPVIERLRELGHRIERLAEWAPACGHAQVIALDEHGFAGGADPRGDGQAAGF